MKEERNSYVGNRYVPKIMGEWNKQETYEGLSIVTFEGTSYTSKKGVPVGVDIHNENYWVVTGNYNAQIENYRSEVKQNGLDLTNYKKEVSKLFNETSDGIVNASVYSNMKEAFEKSVGKTLIIPSGVYDINEPINHVGDINIVCLGNVVFNATTNLSESALTISGIDSDKTYGVTTDISKGSLEINLDTVEGLKIGDVLHLKSTKLWNNSRDYYRKGELIKIKEINGNTVISESPLYDNYTKLELLKVEVFTPSNVTIDNLTIIRKGRNIGVTLNKCTGSINKVDVENADLKGIYLEYCIDMTINDGKTHCNYFEGSGLSYGLAISSSQNIVVNGGYYKAGRHGVSHGGWIPCRNIKHDNVTVDNDEASMVYSFDAHGNVEYLTLSNITALNGMYLAASNIECTQLTSKTRGKLEALRIGVEKSYEYLKLDKLNLESLNNNNMMRVDSSNANDFTINHLTVNNVTFTAPKKNVVSEIMSGVLYFRNINVDKALIDNIYYSSEFNDSFIKFVLELQDTFKPKELTLGGLFVKSPMPALYLSVNDKAHLNNTKLHTTGLDVSPYTIQGNGSIDIQNFESDGGNTTTRSSLRPNGSVKIKNMTLKNYKGEPVRFSGTEDLQIDGLNLINCVSDPVFLSAIPYVSVGAYGQRIFQYPSTPTKGTFKKGDTIVNNNPSVGQPIGWVCIESGNPGTWVGMVKL